MDILVNKRKTDCFYHHNIKYLLCLFDYLSFQKLNLFYKKVTLFINRKIENFS